MENEYRKTLTVVEKIIEDLLEKEPVTMVDF